MKTQIREGKKKSFILIHLFIFLCPYKIVKLLRKIILLNDNILQSHPDKLMQTGNLDSSKKYLALDEAWKVLSVAAKKQEYDACLAGNYVNSKQ